MVDMLNERIHVFAYFRGGRITPVSFTWRGRKYDVKRVTARWVVRDGNNRRYHFAVQTAQAGNLHEIYLANNTMQWFIGAIDTEG
jgi:hypothetical protein